MASYEEEHNIKQSLSAHPKSRHVNNEHLSSFFSMDPTESPTPQSSDFRVLAGALEEANGQSPLVQQLVSQLLQEAENPSMASGVSQTFLDSLDRVPKKTLKQSDSCAICTVPYLEGDYPLVVRLPCNVRHHFDLECIGPWLKLHTTCPLCRADITKREIEKLEDSEEEFEDTYG